MKFTVRLLEAALFLLCFLVLLGKGGSDFAADSLQSMARPYVFSIVTWEFKHVVTGLGNAVKYGRQTLTERQGTQFVLRYQDLNTQIRGLEMELNRMSQSPDSELNKNIRDRLEFLKLEREKLKIKAQFVLETHISLVLSSAGLSYNIPLLKDTAVLFPAVAYSPSPLPYLLVISPREKIEMTDSLLLVPELSLYQIEALESKVEKKGLSAVVERVGGIATYPSLLSDETELATLVEVIAHEWFHQYLFFHPLGRSYKKDYQMTTINETVADIGGKEISGQVLKRYYPEIAQQRGRSVFPSEQGVKTDFDKEMHDIRLQVDALLAQGKIAESEKFMEQKRLELAGKGYRIRKLNQAYFAFHGSYGESSASTSPIGTWLRRVRENSDSLGDFMKKVSGIISVEQLQNIAE